MISTLVCTLTALFFSCTSFAQKRYYTPSAYQVSAHDNGGQLSLSVARGNGYDINVSYSITDYLCILLAYGENNLYELRNTILDVYGIQNNNSHKTARLGYFKNIKKPWINKIEIYLGYCRTKIDNYWSFLEFNPAYAEYAKAEYNAVFIGADAILESTRCFELSFTGRITNYKYGSFIFYEMRPYSYYATSSVEGMKGTNMELISGWGIKYKRFKLVLQGGLSVPISSPSAIQTDTAPTNQGAYVSVHKETLQLGQLIFRLGIQFTTRGEKN